MTKKKIEQIEDELVDKVIEETAKDGAMSVIVDLAKDYDKITNFIDRLEQTPYPDREYDIVVYKMVDRPRYWVGSVAAKSRDSLKDGGKFILDTNGFSTDIDEVIAIVEYIGLKYLPKESKDGILVFTRE